MKRTIKLISVLTAAILAVSALCACTGTGMGDIINAISTELNATEDPGAATEPVPTEEITETEEPAATEAPSVTEEPDVTDAPVLTDEPVVTMSPSNDFESKELELGVPVSVDIDFDGRDDTVLIRNEAVDAWTSDYYIEITTAAHPNETVSTKVSEAYWFNAALLNPDPASGCMYLVSSFGVESDDTCTYIHFADPTTGAIAAIESEMSIGQYDDGEYFHDGMVLFQRRTEVMGTNYVSGQFYLTPSGPLFGGAAYYYPAFTWNDGLVNILTEDDDPVRVLNDIEVVLKTATGVEPYMLKEGDVIWPARTDCEHYVIAVLGDGREVEIDFTIPEDEFIPYMNGYPQDAYFDVFYYD